MGHVTAARVEARSSRSRDDQGYTVEQTVYEPVVAYTYVVDGRTLEGTRLTRVTVASTTQPDLSRYPVGGVVMVYYNPEDPATAYLEVRRSIGAVIIGAMGALFLFEADAVTLHEGGLLSVGKMDLYKEGCFVLKA